VGDGNALRAYWALIPNGERKDVRVTSAFASALIAAGEVSEAQRLIEDHLDGEWDSELAGLYGDCRGGDLLGRISHAEKWLLREPRDARLLLSLGRLCMQSQLWGKAQSYFEASLALAPCREAHIELARLAEGLARGDESARHYREAAQFG
jgi:HemY protein